MKLKSDLAVKKAIDSGKLAGPKIHLSSLYINRESGKLISAEKVTNVINDFADQGVTSLKIYDNVTSAELGPIVEAAHKRGLKVTGHVCAMGFVEAAQAGIDNLEHGLAVDTEFFFNKKPE